MYNVFVRFSSYAYEKKNKRLSKKLVSRCDDERRNFYTPSSKFSETLYDSNVIFTDLFISSVCMTREYGYFLQLKA